MVNAALVSNERNGDQNEDYDQNDALFVFGELENPEQALHFIVRACHTLRVMLSKALQRNPKHEARLSNISGFRHIIRDCSLRSE
jgi:hypothetical protein